ncbi:DUF1707 SHOCT-like domain-containing protein [Corynebacterium uterequi]|nr:DUF1707 domain-containing protein [Corynebacterium uterequi]
MSEDHDRHLDIRVSDAEREHVIEQLGQAMSLGQLTFAEFDERATAARDARVRRDLVPLTADLLEPHPPSPTAPPAVWGTRRPATRSASSMVTNESGGSAISLGVMGGTELSGDWLAASQHLSVAFMGGTEVDLSRARLSSQNTTITAVAFMGGIEVRVPEDVRVKAVGIPFMGGFGTEDAPGVTLAQSDLPEDAPSVTVRGLAFMGGVSVVRVPRTSRPAKN